MTDRKISELPAAALPLTGDELVPLVQGGINEFVPASALGLPSVVETFTTSGTWAKLANARVVEVYVIGGGSAGASGRKGAEGSPRFGGGAGSGGAVRRMVFAADALPATVAVTVGAGGIGGAAVSANSTNGNNGTGGGESLFGSFLRAGGAFGSGSGGTNAAGNGGGGNIDGMSVGQGGASSITATAVFGSMGGAIGAIPGGGGGGGGGRDAANVSRAGGGMSPGLGYADTTRALFGNAGETNPANMTPSAMPSGDTRGNMGGRGGFSGPDPFIRDGGTGGDPGGGGGGGAAGIDGVYDSGRGGDGGPGRVIVITHF